MLQISLNTVVGFLENMSRLLSVVSLLSVLNGTIDKEMVPTPVIQVTRIILSSSLQGGHRVQINQAVILATGLFLVLHMFSRMFS